MLKKILCLTVALSLVAITGCSLVANSNGTDTTTPASIRTIREAKITKAWTVKQMEIDLQSDVSIVLKLKEGDKVDGWYYLVKGDSASFNITGNSAIYTSKATDTETMRVTSDRFSFTASQAQGVAYTLTLSAAPASKSETTTVFLELIYPTTGSLYVPIGTK